MGSETPHLPKAYLNPTMHRGTSNFWGPLKKDIPRTRESQPTDPSASGRDPCAWLLSELAGSAYPLSKGVAERSTQLLSRFLVVGSHRRVRFLDRPLPADCLLPFKAANKEEVFIFGHPPYFVLIPGFERNSYFQSLSNPWMQLYNVYLECS